MKRLIFIPLSFALTLVACAEKKISDSSTAPIETKSTKLSFFMTKPQPTTPVELVLDAKYEGSKPENFRSDKKSKMSGSATFGPQALREIGRPIKKTRTPLYIFDLRQESHGLLNDRPVTWTADREWSNADLNHDEAVRRERRLLGDLRVGETSNGKEIKSIETEESMVRSAGHQYVRLTVTDQVRPTDSEVDRFLEAVRNVPPGAWIHFHCRTGLGRTTTFMILYDMLLNANKDSFDVIVERNKSLSKDPDVLTVGDEKSWQYPFQKERLEFVRQFYNYAKDHPRAETMLWTEWVIR